MDVFDDQHSNAPELPLPSDNGSPLLDQISLSYDEKDAIRWRIPIGFWRPLDAPTSPYPDMRRFFDPMWFHRDRHSVLGYLQAGQVLGAYRGRSVCRLCGAPTGSQTLGDLLFCWPSGLVHDLTAHHLHLPWEFVRYVLRGPTQLRPELARHIQQRRSAPPTALVYDQPGVALRRWEVPLRLRNNRRRAARAARKGRRAESRAARRQPRPQFGRLPDEDGEHTKGPC